MRIVWLTWLMRLALAAVVFVSFRAVPAFAAGPLGVAVEQPIWRIDDVQNGQVDLTVSVLNVGPLPVENAWLLVPTPPGVDVLSTYPASVVHDGQRVFAVGTLAAADRYSAKVTVAATTAGMLLPSPVVHASLAGRHVTAAGRVTRLGTTALPAPYLVSSPDADPTDPPIVAAAAAHAGVDAAATVAALFAFVQHETVHQPYAGALQGARGTLYGRAGNALDRSSLLVALLRASGVPAAYRLGTLDAAGVARLYGEFFPPPGAEDVGGFALDATSLRADLETTLLRLDAVAQATLGASKAARLAALTAMSDDALVALALETTTPDPAIASVLATHAWVEAYLDDVWIALDPSFRSTAVGEVVGAQTSERLDGVPEALRHHVSIRLLRESYSQAFQSQLSTEPPSIEWTAAAGDLVGRAVVASHRYRIDVSSGFIFYTKTTTYEPRLVVRDLERRASRTLGGEEFKEFTSNFGGGIANDFITAISLEVELLGPGQSKGQGIVERRQLADRLGENVRAGGGTVGGDFGSAVTESVDIASLVIQAAHVPPRLVSAEQAALKSAADEAQAFTDAHGSEPPDAPVDAEAVERMRGLADALASTLALLHDSDLGLRARRLATLGRQRAFPTEPRVIGSFAHIDRYAAEPAHRLSLDLIHERLDSVGAPGQRRIDRRTFRMAYGLAATDLESAVIAAAGGWDSVSTHEVMAAALDRGLEFAYLEGQDGLNTTLVPGLIAVSAGARARIQTALQQGLVVVVPRAAVQLGGRSRIAWYEVASDGGLIGRLDDGTGGAALEYAMQMFYSACDLGLFNITDPSTGESHPIPPCPLQNFFQGWGGFTGSMYGLLVPALSAAFACADGDAYICSKLQSNFSDVPGRVLRHAMEQLTMAQSMNDCDVPMMVYDQASALGSLAGYDCPGCTVVNAYLKGVCAYVAQYAWAQTQVTEAIADPVSDGEPGGVMAAALGLPEELHTAVRGVTLTATHGPKSVAGTVTLGHARLSGALDMAFSGGPLVVPARAFDVGSATVDSPPDAGSLSWSGLDQVLELAPTAVRVFGTGALDVYGGLLSTGVAGLATFGGPLEPGAPGTLTAEGPISAVLDLTDAPETFAGTLAVDGAPLTVGRHTFVGGPLTLRGTTAGPLGAESVTVQLDHGSLSLPDVSAGLTVDGQPAPMGLALAGVTGDVSIVRTSGKDHLTVAAVADTAWLTIDAPAPGHGPFSVGVTASTSIAGDYRFDAQAPDGWSVVWSGMTLLVTPPAEAPAGTTNITVHVTGQGFDTSATVPVTVLASTTPAATVMVAEDLNFVTETGGLRVPAYLVSIHHVGPGPATYALTSALSPSSLTPRLAATSVTIAPGETRRVALHVERSSPEALWPAPGAPLSLAVTAVGPVTATGVYQTTIGPVAAFAVDVTPRHVILAPGASASVPIRVRSVGNMAAVPTLTLGNLGGVSAVLAPPLGPLAPGEATSLALEVTAPADGGQLPKQYGVIVSVPQTSLEVARGLEAVSTTLGVRVTRAGTEGLISLVEQAERDGDTALVTAGLNAFARLDSQLDACSAAAMATLAQSLNALASALLQKPGREALAAGLTSAASALALDGCAALDSVRAATAGLGDLPTLPDLAAGLSPLAPVLHGSPLIVHATIVNAGAAPTTPSAARVTVRRNAAPLLAFTVDVPGLAPGGQFAFDVTGATDALLGDYVVDVEADALAVVPEASETDNHAAGVLHVLAEDGPPLTNHAPDFTSQPPTLASAGEAIDYAPTALDVDGDAVFLFLVTAPRGISFDGQHLKGKINRAGEYPLTLMASDVFGATTLQSVTLTVANSAVINTPPTLSGAASTRLLVGAAWSWTPTVADPDGDAVVVSLASAPVGLSLAGDTLHWTPTALDAGVHFVSLLATDARGATATRPLALTVAAAPAGPNLVVRFASAGESPTLIVANTGETNASASGVVVWEERDGVEGPTAGDVSVSREWTSPTVPGGQREFVVPYGATTSFPGNVLHAMVDPADLVVESNEDDNTADSVSPAAPSVWSYVGWRPDVTTPFTLLAPETPVAWRAVDPDSLMTVAAGLALPGVPVTVDPTRVIGQSSVPLAGIAFEADGPLQVYYIHEPLGADFGADLFHPTVAGQKVGTRFVVYVPTSTSNNALVIHAVDDADIAIDSLDGLPLTSANLGAGEAWSPVGLVSGGIYRIDATGRIVVQSSSVTGCSAVPATDSADGDDVGRDFLFSIRSRGAGGGALAVIGYSDAAYTVTLPDGQPLLSGTVAAGAVTFHAGLGEHRGLRLVATGPVGLLAGDVSRAGADRVGLMGEDLTQTVGRGGLDLIVPTLEQTVGQTVLLAGPAGAALELDGTAHVLGAYGLLALPDDTISRVHASSPLRAQLQGGGDRYFDLGEVLRAVPFAPRVARPVLAEVSIDVGACAAVITGSARLGNGGSGAIAAGGRLELVEFGSAGATILTTHTLDSAVASGEFVDVDLEAERTPAPGVHVFAVRFVPALADDPVLVSPTVTADCANKAPSFVSTPITLASLGQPYVYTPLALDPEGDAVTYALVEGPPGAMFDPDGPAMLWSPSDTSTAIVVLSATDALGATSLQSFALTIGLAPTCGPDADGDGACPPRDCDDTTAEIGPAVAERAGNGVDDDCSSLTPDVVPAGAASLTLTPESAIVFPGVAVTLDATVTNGGGLQTLVGLSVTVDVTCGPESWTVTGGVPSVGPKAAVTIAMTRPEGVASTGTCTAKARLSAGPKTLAQADATFSVSPGLAGQLSVNGNSLEWAVTSLADAPITTTLTVGPTELAPWAILGATTIAPGESSSGLVPIPAGLAPALYVVALRASGARLASVSVDVADAPSLTLLRTDVGVADDATVSPIRTRPLGPYPGGASAGGQLSGAWDDGEIRLRIMDFDTSTDADDAVHVVVAAEGEAPVEIVWVRASGAVTSDGVSVEVSPVPAGVEVIVHVPAAMLGGGLPKPLWARVELRDGTQTSPKGAWIWAAATTLAPGGPTYGPLILVEPSVTPADEDPGDLGPTDVNSGDASSDEVSSGDVDPSDADEPDTQVPSDAVDQPTDTVVTDTVDTPADVVDASDVVGPPADANDGADVGASAGELGGPDTGTDAASTDVGSNAPADDGGCGCRTAPRRSLPTGGVIAALLLGLWAIRRRVRGAGRARSVLLSLFIGCGGAESAAPVTEAASDTGGSDAALDVTAVDVTEADLPGASADLGSVDATADVSGGEEVVGSDVGEAVDVTAQEDTATEDTAPDDTAADDATPADIEPVETQTSDAASPDIDSADADANDISASDASDTEVIASGTVGATCTNDGDCASNLCLAGADYAVCSASCDTYPCPDGWVCSDWLGGGRVCVPKAACVDGDGDGAGVGRGCTAEDCDDAAAAIHPGAIETCDGVDDDCDGQTDEGVLNACGTCGALSPEACNGFDDDCDGDVDQGVTNACGDCGASPTEVCNSVDDDCNGLIDDAPACAPVLCLGPIPCWSADPALLGAGSCTAGTRACVSGVLGACEGEVVPSPEVCNGADDDCDGATDEGTLNVCGVCAPSPIEACNGLDDDCDGDTDEGVRSPCGGCTPCGETLVFPSEFGTLDKGLTPAPDGGVTLGVGQVDYHYIWVPNSVEGSISKWDTRTGRELGRYWIGTNPSRTAIDLEGNAWVGHRGDGTATHLFTNKADCIDRNGNGVIDTSADLNDDGLISYGEMRVQPGGDPLADECVACQVHVGTSNDLIRGLAIDRENHAWLGTWNSAQIFRVNPDTCAVETTIATNFEGGALNIYGMAIAGTGSLWTSTLTNNCTLEVDTALGAVIRRRCTDHMLYGIAVDSQGRPWFGDNGRGVAMFDPKADTWSHFIEPSGQLQEVDGVVVGTDDRVYGAGYASNHIARFDPGTETWTLFSTTVGLPVGIKPQWNPRGVTFDSEGDIWAIFLGSSGLMEFSTDGVAKRSRDILAFDNPKIGTGPYSYSDNTGFQLFNYTVSEASWSYVFDAKADVTFVALALHRYTPAGTAITVVARSAATLAALADAPWTAPLDGDQPALEGLVTAPAQLLELRVTLKTSDPKVKPVLRDVRVFFRTADCRTAGCPSGQLCEPVFGGCIVLPAECDADADCPASTWCDASGHCQAGCRLTPGACPSGRACDPVQRLCLAVPAECKADAECAFGRYCGGGQCLDGCRSAPDSCAQGYLCDAASHTCTEKPPECAGDPDCAVDEYCGPTGACLTGCRSGLCDEGLLCHTAYHVCVAAPAACDPAHPEPEVCDGLDNDCNGQTDEAFSETGVTCAVGTAATGAKVCYDGRVVCRATPSGPGAAPVVLAGALTNVLLPAGPYAVAESGTLGGLVVLEPGAEVTGTQAPPLAEWNAYQALDLRLTGASVRGLSIGVHAGGAIRLDGALCDGTATARATFEVNGGAPTSLVVQNSRFRDVQLLLGSACSSTIEHTRIEGTDAVARWLVQSWGPVLGKHVEISGLRTLPRVQYGWLVYGPLALEQSQLDTVTIGLQVQTASQVDITDTAFVVCDEAVLVTGTSFPTISDCVVDSADPGHKALGLGFEGLTRGGGARITGTTFLLDPYDRAFDLDPDQFNQDSPSEITASTFIGVSAIGQYGLRGTGEAGTQVITLLDAATEYVLTGNVLWVGTTVTASAPVVLRAANPAWQLSLTAYAGAHLTLSGVALEDVAVDAEPGSPIDLDGVTITHTVASDRIVIYANSATATLRDVHITGNRNAADTYRYGNAIQLAGSATATITGGEIADVRAAVILLNESVATVSHLTIGESLYGLYVGQTSHLTADHVTLTAHVPTIETRAIWADLARGGDVSLSDLTIDVGPEDFALLLDPDAYQVATPSTVTNVLTPGGARIAPALIGRGEGGTIALDPRNGTNELRLTAYNAEVADATVTVASGLLIRGPADRYSQLAFTGATTATVPAGVSWRDVTLLTSGGTLTMTGADFVSSTGVGRDLLYVGVGTTVVYGGTFTGFGFGQNGVDVQSGGSVSLDHVEFTDLAEGVRPISGSATITNANFRSTATVSGARRDGVGLFTREHASASCTHCTFRDLSVGVRVHDQSDVTLSASDFVNCQYGLYVFNLSSCSASGCTFTDTDSLLISLGVWLDARNGGQLSASGLAFTLGAEDTALRLTPDAFQDATPTTLSGLTFAGGVAPVISVEGLSGDGSRTVTAPASGVPLILSGDTQFQGGTVQLAAGLELTGPSGAYRRLVVRDGATLSTEPGVHFTNAAVHVWGGASADLSGAHFDYPAPVDEYVVYAGGHVTGAGLSVTSGIRRALGLFVGNGGSADLVGATFAGLGYGALVEDGGSATLTSPVFTGNTFAGTVRGVGHLALSDATVEMGDPAVPSTGLMTQSTRVGISLDAAGTHFDLGALDRPFRFDLEAFAEGSHVGLTGSTFEGGEQGQGYRLSGQTNVIPLVTLAPLEAAQPAYVLEGTTGVYGSASLVIGAGVVLQSASLSSRMSLRADNTATLTLDGVTTHDIEVGWAGDARGHVTNCTLDGTTPGAWALIWTTSTVPLVVHASSFAAAAPAASALIGLFVGAPGAATVTNSTFTGLDCALSTQGALITADGLTFVGNTRDQCP